MSVDEKWQEVSPDFFRFEKEGQEVTGVLAAKDSIEVRGTPVGRYTIDTEEGSVSFLGGVSLDPLLAKIQEGQLIKLVFLGMAGTQRGTQVKQFKLYVPREE